MTDDDGCDRGNWERLHRQARFRPRYPSESVVRFVATATVPGQRVLDLGCGAGRHLTMLEDLRLRGVGADLSMVGLRYAAEMLREERYPVRVTQSRMQALPFADESFDAAVAYGVLYYNDAAGYQAAVGELWRVLRPGGQLFVVTRSCSDRRVKTGPGVGERTVQLGLDAGPEAGMTLHFMTRAAITRYFGAFTDVQVNRQERSVEGIERGWWDVDWLIQAVKPWR